MKNRKKNTEGDKNYISLTFCRKYLLHSEFFSGSSWGEKIKRKSITGFRRLSEKLENSFPDDK